MSNEYYDEKRRKRKSEIIKGLVFLVAFFAILYGYFVPVVVYESSGPIEYYTDVIGRKNSPKLSGTVYLKNVPIYLEGNTSLTQYDLNKWTEKVPDVLLQYCSEIYLENFDNSNTMSYQAHNGNFEDGVKQTNGFVVRDGTGRIYINSKSYNKLNTIIHELMHRYDEVYGVISKNEQVIDLYNQYANQISSYATTDSGEFLAESAVQYFLEPEKLQQNAQPVYDYFQSLFHYYS